jgi:D-alanine-D-alanine ligase
MWIAVLYNTVQAKETGFSGELVAENEIIATAAGIVEALRPAHQVVSLRVGADLLGRIGRSPFDLVFNLAENLGDRMGTEHLIPAMLDAVDLPYTGADGTTIALCRDKARTRNLLQAAGLPVPPGQLFARADEAIAPELGYPLIVKPSLEDASIGITRDSVVRDEEALRARVAFVLEHYRQPALVERFVEGREINCALLGNGDDVQALPLAEIVFAHPDGHPSIVTFESKWESGWAVDRAQRPVCPADLPAPLAQEIVAAARGAFRVTGCRDYARIDFRVAEGRDGRAIPFIIDVNPNPAIDEGAGFARSARAAGLEYPHLAERITALAASRRPARPRPGSRPPAAAIEGPRLRLVPPAPGHLETLARWFSDPEGGRWMDDPGSTCTAEELADAYYAGRDDLDFVACDKATGAPVGYCGLYDIDHGRAKITFLVGDAAQRGRGVGREMGELLLAVAFDRLGLHALDASVVVENAASVRLCRALGFHENGRLRGSHRLGDRRYDEILLELTAADR